MKPIVTKELIFDYFKGSVSAIQRQEIAQWARERANEEQLYRWLEEFETLYPEYNADLEIAVRNYYTFLSGLNESSGENILLGQVVGGHSAGKRSSWISRWNIAVGIALLFGITAFLSRDLWMFKTYRTEIGEQRDFILPDGSEVSLGTNSLLKVPRWRFARERRDVYLLGCASFNVRHTPDNKKFVVQAAKRFEVAVLGTEFNVVARETGSRVILKNGKVQLNLHTVGEERKVDLKPGDVFTLSSTNKLSLNTSTLPEIEDAWQGHLYIFDKTSLSEIMNQLKEGHGLVAKFVDPKLELQTITGKFSAESVDELFELIQDILGIRIIRHGNNVIISRIPY